MVGGLDVTKALIDEGEFWKQVPLKYKSETKKQKQEAPTTNTTTPANQPVKQLSKEELNLKLKGLIETAPVMLFMKGSPDAPRCGFSSKVVERLKKNKIDFKSFDILSDETVRSGLKVR